MSSDQLTRMLDPAMITRTLADIADATAGGPTVALAGGVALMFYGSDRFTKDIDIVSGFETVPPWPRIAPLSFGGFQTTAPSGAPVDVMVRSDDFALLFADALVYAAPVAGCPILVVTREHIAAMKMVAGRKKDEADLEFLILRGGLDISRAREVIRRTLGAYALKEFDQQAAIIRWQGGNQ